MSFGGSCAASTRSIKLAELIPWCNWPMRVEGSQPLDQLCLLLGEPGDVVVKAAFDQLLQRGQLLPWLRAGRS